MRAPSLLSLTLVCLTSASLVACAGKQVPQHSGYKGKKPTPWTRPKVIELDDEFAAKAETELDYAAFKRAKWFELTLPGPGALQLDLESVPAGDEDMDVAMEVLDANNHVLVRADADSEDVNEQKKQRTLSDLAEGTYLIHVFLEGRLNAADVELRLKFMRGDRAWKSDFPNQVSFVGELPIVPPLDDTPDKPVKVAKVNKRPRRVPTTEPTAATGRAPLVADITDVQPSTTGSKIVVGGGTSDGLDNGMRGSVTGVKNASFTLSGCNANRCFANVRAAVDDVRSAGTVIVRP